MSEPRYISPMLDGFSLGEAISDHSGVECYPAMRDDSDKRYIVKKISLPASQVQVEALLLTGVFRDDKAVRSYYEELAQSIGQEVRTLNALAEQRGFVPCQEYQIVPMEFGTGFEVHLLSRYRKTLERHTRKGPMTHLGAVNLGIDLCAALAVCREAGWLYVDLKPENIFVFGDQEYRIGDLGFISMDSLQYASLPDRYRSIYTAPEVADAYDCLNATMDTYALGLVLYQLYNGGKLPFDGPEGRRAWLDRLASGESIEPPCCADEEMAGIITKACAYAPADRWPSPAEMGRALIAYMQRNEVNDIPLVPSAKPEPEEEPAEEIAEEVEETVEIVEEVEETPVDEIVEEIVETPTEEIVEEVEETPVEEIVEEVVETPTEEIVEEVEETPAEEIVEETEETPADEIIEEAEETPVEEIVEEVEETPVEEIVEKAEETPVEEIVGEAEETPVEEIVDETEETPVEESEDGDWIDLMDAILSEDAAAGPDEEDTDGASLRELLADEEYLDDALNVSDEDVTAETAEFLSFAQELIDHEAPAPLVAPEPIDVPIPEPIPIELPEEDEEEPIVLDLPEEDEENEEEETESESAPAAADAPAPAEPRKSSGLLKKLVGAAAALAVVAGLAFGGWHFYRNYYLQTIDSMTYDGFGTQVTVNVTTAMDQSKLTVICKDTYGNAVTGTLENGVVTFSDLVPGSQYIISLEAEGFHKLVGSTSVTYSTPAETHVMHLAAVTGQEAGSAIISFGVEGGDSEEWTLTYTAEGLEPQSVTFAGHTVTVTGLTVGTEYTFTLAAPEGVLLVGENVITHTASELVQASDLVLSGYSDGVLSVKWTAPEGVDRWIVRCTDGAGYDQLQEVTGTAASFEGVTEGSKYTVEVTAANMTLGIRTELTAKASSISDFTAALKGSNVELSWTADIPCAIDCSADGKVLQVLNPEENQAVYGPVVPGTTYSFTVRPAEGDAAVPGGTATVEVPAAGTFSANKLSSDTIIVESFAVPSKSNWSYSNLLRAKEEDTFSAGGSMALLYTVTKPYSFDSTQFESIFVIRDAEGKLVSTASRTRVWDKMWNNGYCTETVSNLPAVAGDYTLSIYLAGGLLAELPFTVK